MKEMVIVQFPDGKTKEFAKGVKVKEVADTLSVALRKNTVVAKVNGVLVDVEYALTSNIKLELFTLDTKEGLQTLRHSAAHVLAQAVQRLYQSVQLGVGPVIEDGFFYDFNLENSLTLEDLQRIEVEMKRIVKEDLSFKRIVVTREEAKEILKQNGQKYKLELLETIPEHEPISFYQQGEFIDLCRGPHIPSTSFLKVYLLNRVSGAYWQGNQEKDVLQRVYGLAFSNQKAMKEYIRIREEAEKRNHRKIGKQLQLFMFSEEAPGMPFYLPNGQIIRNELEQFSRQIQLQAGYEEVRTPLMMNQQLWEQSGHWEHYRDNMYFSEVDEARFAMKPMNCPGHMLIFKNQRYSYRDLPVRLAEFGQVHRHEYSGALNGMFRVRTFCQDDAHIFARDNQIEEEIKQIILLINEVYQTFGFEYTVELSTRPEDSMGDDALWMRSEAALQHVLEELQIRYELNEGDGAFYGPKIDFHIKDALNRSHQCGTIQLDFQMPEKFNLTYINERNEKVRPVVIHRAIYGSIDRFLGILIEHFAGVLPVWLAPIQVEMIPVSVVHLDRCMEIQGQLRNENIRVKIDRREEKLSYKIREAQLRKSPFILVIGDEEVRDETVNVRRHGARNAEQVKVDVFIEMIKKAVITRTIH